MNQRELSLAIDGFDPIAYWSMRDVKIWVVEVTRGSGRDQQKHTTYVRARTRDGAERCACENTFIKGNVSARARLATPRDLECVPDLAASSHQGRKCVSAVVEALHSSTAELSRTTTS